MIPNRQGSIPEGHGQLPETYSQGSDYDPQWWQYLQPPDEMDGSSQYDRTQPPSTVPTQSIPPSYIGQSNLYRTTSRREFMEMSYGLNPTHLQALTDSAEGPSGSEMSHPHQTMATFQVQPQMRPQNQDMPPPARPMQIPDSFGMQAPPYSLSVGTSALRGSQGSVVSGSQGHNQSSNTSAFGPGSYTSRAARDPVPIPEPEWAKYPIQAHSKELGQYRIKLQVRQAMSVAEDLPKLSDAVRLVLPLLSKLSWLSPKNFALRLNIQEFSRLLGNTDFQRFLPEEMVSYLLTQFDILHTTMSNIPDNTPPPKPAYQPDTFCQSALSILWCDLPAILTGFEYATQKNLPRAAYERYMRGSSGRELADELGFPSNSYYQQVFGSER